MAEIIIDGIRKTFDGTAAVSSFSAKIDDGEFFTLLGPSGCGKTTMLRMIAGFIEPDKGRICISKTTVVNHEEGIFLQPEKRNIGMVFQSYAVWPHMTVYGNVAYPLKVRKLPAKLIKEKTKRILSLSGLEQLAERYPHQLSGGQQQRVALARALVMDPPVMLLDEPLSNLDAKLREKMRFEIKELQRRTGVTIIYVTHDQSEALAMSDRILVMNKGVIQQIGSPLEIYQNPSNKFVADFIGLTNLIPCNINNDGNILNIAGYNIAMKNKNNLRGNAVLSIRPDDIIVSADRSLSDIMGTVSRITYLGNTMDYLIKIGNMNLRVQGKNLDINEGDSLSITLPEERMIFFSPDAAAKT